MPNRSSLARSIAFYGAAYFLVQIVIVAGTTIVLRGRWPLAALFAGILAVYHALLTVLLLARKEDFHREGEVAPLPRVNPSNALTLARLSSIPTLLFLIILASDAPVLPVLLPFACLVFASDMFDGILARRRNEITFVGRYLDSSSDYLMIIAVSIVFYHFALIPLWLFLLIMARLVLFAMGMAILALREGKADPLSTFLGKASIFSLMVLYAMEIAQIFRVPVIGDNLVVTIIEYVVAAVVSISIVDKAVFLIRMFAKVRAEKENRARLP
jgi:phosphatidylglycerophosphate synthase